jgi:pimeloyl-ACP methyl ester carboxylesterase
MPSVIEPQPSEYSQAQKNRHAAYREATPVIDTPTLPVILLQGDADAIVPSLQANLAGATPRVIKAGGHFDWLHPETLSFSAFYEELIK